MKPSKRIIFPTRIALILILPSIFLYAFFNIWPMVFSIGLAFTDATRYNIAPSPERLIDIKNAITCAESLKTSTEYLEKAKVVLHSTMENLTIIKNAFVNILNLIEKDILDEKTIEELKTNTRQLRTAVTALRRVLPDIKTTLNCTELGYPTNIEIIPKETLDKIDGLYMITGQLYTFSLTNFIDISTDEIRKLTENGLDLTLEIEARFKMLKEDYEGYLDSFVQNAKRDLEALELKIIGLSNFYRLFHDPRFYNSLIKTLLFTAISVPMKVLTGLLLAFLYSTPIIYGRKALRALLLVPWATPFLLSALTWKFLFLPNGQLGMLLGLNINVREWDAFLVYCLFETWLAYPFIMTITQGALSGVSKDVIEASYIDGASLWTRMKRVVFPQIARPVMIATILTTGASLQAFMIPLVLNGGGPYGTVTIPYIGSSPGNLNEMLILFGYNRVMIDNEWGYAASIYLIILAIILTYVSTWFMLSRKPSR